MASPSEIPTRWLGLGSEELEVRVSVASVRSLPAEIVGPRYVVEDRLGAGGVGDVVAAVDREVRRTVALKTLQRGVRAEPTVIRRFVDEARITAQLEHPGIIPIYDLGTAPDGQPYYTMRVVKQRSMRDVLSKPRLREQWSLGRLLGAFLQLCRALAYAHSRGVLHRDIKPENVLLGDFGEVYLADWGLARVGPQSTLSIHGEGSCPPAGVTDAGGTPGYVPPEALRGHWDAIDQRADLFAMGVILYEILAGQGPFDARSTAETLIATVEREPRAPRELNPSCPLLLEDLCLALLAKDPAGRPSSAADVADRIEQFLEGAKEKERRREEARALCRKAQAPVARYQELERARQRLVGEALERLKSVKAHEPVEQKRVAWQLEDAAAKAERETGLALAEALELYTKALGYDAQCESAHQGLADLYWGRARLAEQLRKPAEQVYYEALVTEHDQGRYAALLVADGCLSLDSSPSGAHVIAQRYSERDRVLVLGDERYLGRTPVREVRLEPGSYLLTIKSSGHRDARCPVLVTRGGHREAFVNMYTDEEIGEGFVYVPGGAAIIGGDPEAYDPLARQELVVPDFAIGRFPVTLREYCAFLDTIEPHDPALAEKRAPHDALGTDGLYVRRGPSGLWEPDTAVIIEGEARKLFPAEDGHLWRVPALLVDWFDARAYCRSVGLRMPTEHEWEKAARGVDGRFYPWGDRFDATFCLMRESRPFAQQPEPVGTFATDESPYGVRDMAGGMREWVADIVDQKSALELDAEDEPPPGTARGESTWRQVRSGNWNADQKWARAASRGGQFALLRGTGLTFRCAKTLRKSPF